MPMPPTTDLLYTVLCACLFLSPDSTEASSLIIPAYQSPELAPQPPRSRNLVYFSCDSVPSSDLYDAQELVALPAVESVPPEVLSANPSASPETAAATPAAGSRRPRVSTLLTFRLLLVCYGPDSLQNALRIRSFLFLDGHGRPKSLLRKAGFFPVPDPPAPAVLREPEGSLWRQRADVSILLRTLATQTYPADQPMITHPAEPRIYVQY